MTWRTGLAPKQPLGAIDKAVDTDIDIDTDPNVDIHIDTTIDIDTRIRCICIHSAKQT